MLWSNYQAWCAESDEIITRLYVARMGHADRQTGFQVRHDRTHNMPLGDYMYTWVEFNYHDPKNGIYRLKWDLLAPFSSL
jgi:hypothetical protein